jgi:hypothetical protein
MLTRIRRRRHPAVWDPFPHAGMAKQAIPDAMRIEDTGYEIRIRHRPYQPKHPSSLVPKKGVSPSGR